MTLFADPSDALREIVRRHPRKCGIRYSARPKGWTCRDEMTQAHARPNHYVKEYGNDVRAGRRLCDVCVAVEGLNAGVIEFPGTEMAQPLAETSDNPAAPSAQEASQKQHRSSSEMS